MTEIRALYATKAPPQPSPEQVQVLDNIRLIAIEDIVDAAQEQGFDRVSLSVDDARWLIARCRGEKK